MSNSVVVPTRQSVSVSSLSFSLHHISICIRNASSVSAGICIGNFFWEGVLSIGFIPRQDAYFFRASSMPTRTTINTPRHQRYDHDCSCGISFSPSSSAGICSSCTPSSVAACCGWRNNFSPVTSIVILFEKISPVHRAIRAGQIVKDHVAVGCNWSWSWIWDDCCPLTSCIEVDCACPRTVNLSTHWMCTSPGFCNHSTCTVSQNVIFISTDVVDGVSVIVCHRTNHRRV